MTLLVIALNLKSCPLLPVRMDVLNVFTISVCEQGEPNAVNSNRPSCRSSLQKKALIHQKVRDVVLKTLAPKEVKYDYIFERSF